MSPVLAHSAIGALAEPASDQARHRRASRERLDGWRTGLERRAHRRLAPRDVDRLCEARLKYGPAVQLLDLSAGGVQFETSRQLRPDTDVVLHLTGEDLDTLMPSRVVRCHVSKLNGGPSYRSAVAFRRSLDLPDLIVPSMPWMDPPTADVVETGFALNTILDRYVGLEPRGGRASAHDRARILLEALHLLQASAAQRVDPADPRLAELLARVAPALREGQSMAAVTTRIEEQVRLATAAPEAIRARDVPEGWHRIVVRFTDGMLLRGYTNDFHASRRQLHLSESPLATADRLVVPIARAKAVFFVRDLAGDPARVDGRTFTHPPRGRRIEVTFNDGEVLLGSTLNYQPDGQGFFLEPADATGNNIRVFVISGSVRHARFLPA